MKKQSIAELDDRMAPSVRNGVFVVSGYGVRVSVERGHLMICGGIADARWQQRLARVERSLRRFVILGHAGVVTLDAIRWLYDIGASVAHIDADGTLLFTSAKTALDDPRLRRAQALATTNESGLAIARQLIRQKVEAQAQLAVELAPAAAPLDDMHALFAEVEQAKGARDLMVVEASVASLYWRLWKSVDVRFAQRDRKRIPKHWRTFGSRQSVLSGSQRRAANPANAILNYLYTILEAEARIACRTMGLDPGLGVLHSDQPARDSLAFDVMEPVRPAVDAYVLKLLANRIFTRQDFFETRDGNCRIMPSLARVLAQTAPQWGTLLAPVVEDVAKRLLEFSNQGSSSRTGLLPTPLTERHRRAGRDRYRKQPAPAARTMPKVQRTCSTCGKPLPSGRSAYCNTCWRERKQKVSAKCQAATQRRSERTEVRRVKLESAPSRRSRSADQFVFNILPRLQRIPAKEIAQATGLSAPYCALVKKGRRIPHPRHWPTFSEMVRARVR